MRQRPPLIYEFGPYRLEVTERRLTRNGQDVPLRPKVFDLLVVLIEHRGHMVEKDEIIGFLWPDMEVEDNNLTVSINALRRAFGDDNFIETVSRRGYRFAAEVKVATASAAAYAVEPRLLDEPQPPGGALPLGSRFYVTRRTDEEFHAAMARRDSIVLVKGARQVGKTSLLARGLQQVRAKGVAVVLTDFQQFSASAFETVEKLLVTLGELIADQLDLSIRPHEKWNSFVSPSSNFDSYLRREVFTKIDSPLVWGIDEADRLFGFDYAGEIFGLFRSWHNLRALDPGGPWERLTMAIAYATEAHLFITDLNQSPFNVGTRLTLEDFNIEHVAELERRYGGPLRNEEELVRFHKLLGGHPYLTQRGLYEMARSGIELAKIEAEADEDEGVFGDHLRRMLASLERDAALCDALRAALDGHGVLSVAHFYRLRSAGVLSGDSPKSARARCELYARYLKKRLL